MDVKNDNCCDENDRYARVGEEKFATHPKDKIITDGYYGAAVSYSKD
jgi:hypothetical protein